MHFKRLTTAYLITFFLGVAWLWAETSEIPIPYYDTDPLELDYFQMGDTKLGLSTQDTLNADDLSRIVVEGYDIENAVVVNQPDPHLPLVPASSFHNLPEDPRVQIINFDPQTLMLVVECPSSYIWKTGDILSDTSYGGWVKKINTAQRIGHSISGARWQMHMTRAALTECIRQGDISFIAKPNLTITPNDSQWIIHNQSSHMGIAIQKTKININPVIQGRLRIQDGEIVTNTFQISGRFDIFAYITVNIPEPSKFNLEQQLPVFISHHVPLGTGLFINITHTATIALDLESLKDNFVSTVTINNSDLLKASFTYAQGSWYPLASLSDNGQAVLADPNINIGIKQSSGMGRISIQPQITLKWCNDNGLRISQSSYFKLFQIDNFLKSVNITASTGSQTHAEAISSPDFNTVHFPSTILTSLEKTSFVPPIAAPVVSIQNVDDQSITLQWEAILNNTQYYIQLKNHTQFLTIDSLPQTQYTLSGLQPQTEYIFRVIPTNAFGFGIPGSIVCTTTTPNMPPSPAGYLTPLSDALVSPEKIFFSWTAEDPNPSDKLLYTVFLDTKNPPMAVISHSQADSFLVVPNLKYGQHYFWKVDVSDGKLHTPGEVNSFSTIDASPKVSVQLPDHLVKIPGGAYIRSDGKKITLSPFYMDKYEITQARFQSVMKSNPSHHKGDSRPVENVNWYAADKFCKEQNGRLPTEAEWEFAARGNQSAEYYWGNLDPDGFAWYWDNAKHQTQPVGQKKPNEFGLHDMHGNVFEWVQDWFAPYPSFPATDPTGPSSGKSKVTRGGSWYSDSKNLKAYLRFKNRPSFSSYKLGFRCVYNIPQTSATAQY